MMKANELRIGNYVVIDNETSWPHLKDIPMVVMGISQNMGFDSNWTHSLSLRLLESENIISNSFSQLIQFIQPIVLTEEWLERFGCKEGNKLDYTYSRFGLSWKDGYKYWSVTDLVDGTYLTKVEWVHEWQNFVFAMNGGELQLKGGSNG